MTEHQSQKLTKHNLQVQIPKDRTETEDCILISRKRNVKKPFLSKNIAILYTPKPITLKPRSSYELNMGITFHYPDYILPECNLLPSF